MNRLILTLMLPVLALGLPACGESPPAPGPAAEFNPLPAVQAAVETVPQETALDGVIEAINQSTVSAQTSARVAELPYDVGDYVPQDAVIARLRGKEPKARQEQALAALEGARSSYEEAKLNYERARPLAEQGVISQNRMDEVTAAFEQARARYEQAKAAAVEAEAALDYTTIRAPYAGVVTERHVQLGELVQPGTPLMSGLSLEALRVSVDVPQSRIEALRAHRQARVILPDGRSVDGEELTVFPYADEATHTVRVRVQLPDALQAMYPGMLVKVVFVTGQVPKLLVPGEAITRRSEVTGIYVQTDSGLEFRQVRIGKRTRDGRVPVLTGLSEGESVVTDPVDAAVYFKSEPEIVMTGGTEL